jgi:hypothetical protein
VVSAAAPVVLAAAVVSAADRAKQSAQSFVRRRGEIRAVFVFQANRSSRPPRVVAPRATTAHAGIGADHSGARYCHFGEPHSSSHADRPVSRKPIGSGPVRLTLKHLRLQI